MFRRFAVVTLAFIGIFNVVFASTLMKVEDRDLAQSASWIGLVKILKLHNLGADRPASIVEAEVLDVVKGSSRQGEKISFELPGGKVGAKQTFVLGLSPKDFKAGAEYFIYLDRSPVSMRVSLGGAAAQLQNWTAYSVSQERSGRKFVKRVGSLASAERKGGALAIRHAEERVKAYEDFVTQVFRDMN